MQGHQIHGEFMGGEYRAHITTSMFDVRAIIFSYREMPNWAWSLICTYYAIICMYDYVYHACSVLLYKPPYKVSN